MFNNSFYIKVSIISLLLFIESLFLSLLIVNVAQQPILYTQNTNDIPVILVLMYLISVTYSLSAGGWGTKIKYLPSVFPISLSLFLTLVNKFPNYAFLFSTIFFVVIFLKSHSADKYSKQLIKFNPNRIYSSSSKTILFLFALLGGFLAYKNVNSPNFKFDLQSFISNAVKSQTKVLVSSGALGSIIPQIPQTGDIEQNLNELVTAQIVKAVQPYIRFLPHTVGVLVFGVLQFVELVSTLIFTLTIGLVFRLAIKLKLMTKSKIMIESEKVVF